MDAPVPPPALFHDDRELDLEALELWLWALLALPPAPPPRRVWMTGASRLLTLVVPAMVVAAEEEAMLTSAADRFRDAPPASAEVVFRPLMGLRAGEDPALLADPEAVAAEDEDCFRRFFLPPAALDA